MPKVRTLIFLFVIFRNSWVLAEQGEGLLSRLLRAETVKLTGMSVYRVEKTGDVERMRTKTTSVSLYSAKTVRNMPKLSKCLVMGALRRNASMERSG